MTGVDWQQAVAGVNSTGAMFARQVWDTVMMARARMAYGVEREEDLELHVSPGAMTMLLLDPSLSSWAPIPMAGDLFWRGIRVVRRRDLEPDDWSVVVRLKKQPARAAPEPEPEPDTFIPTGCDCGYCDG